LLQFHWWDYSDRSYIDALKHLADVRNEGRIRHLALTNFDTERLRIISDGGFLPRSRHHAAHLWHRARRTAVGKISRASGAAAQRAQHRVAAKVQQYDRCMGRMDALPGTAQRV